MNEMNVTQMYWRPPLIRLTQIARGVVPETICFIQPECIEQIVRAEYRLSDMDGKPTEQTGVGTFVLTYSRSSLIVTEATETIARLRDEAFGYTEKRSATMRSIGGEEGGPA